MANVVYDFNTTLPQTPACWWCECFSRSHALVHSESVINVITLTFVLDWFVKVNVPPLSCFISVEFHVPQNCSKFTHPAFNALSVCLSLSSPLVLGNLWDVTDRDIDRFTSALLQSWLSGGSGSSLLQHLVQSRDATHLKHMIGAAPVAYGLPVHLC